MRAAPTNGALTYEEFYNMYYFRVLRYLSAKCVQTKDAEDLASQVFLYCYQNFSNYDPTKASIASWVYMIANSRFKNYCRDRRSYVDVDAISEFISDESNPIDAALMLDDMRDAIADALLKLSEKQRMIVVMRYFKDMSATEIGRKLGMTPINVRVQLSRALDKLEIELKMYK